MAPSMIKRRKLEHHSSSEENDSASFASFGESADGDEVLEESGAAEAGDISRGLSGEDADGPLDNGNDDAVDNHKDVDRDETTKAVPASDHSTNGRPLKIAKQFDTVGRGASGATIGPKSNKYTAGTFKSTMFKLQVDELLEQIRPRQGKKESEAEDALHKLKKTIESISDRDPLPVEDAERQLLISSKVAVPFPNPRPPRDAKYKLQYSKPTNINIVGSHVLKTGSRSKRPLEVDMAVTMPASLFQEKDYLNFRYFYKRAYYLACIAAGLKDSHDKAFQLRFQNFHSNPLQPIIVVTPNAHNYRSTAERASPKWQINILPCIAGEVFAPGKLIPDKNCVREQNNSTTDTKTQRKAQKATSFYNSSLRSDTLVLSYLKLQHATWKRCDTFRDACLLGSTWLRQRGFDSGMHADGFGNFEWNALIALLLQSGGPNGRPMLSEGYSSYQLFKATLQLLATKDLANHPLVVGTDSDVPKVGTSGPPVVWDGERQHSLLYKMKPWSYKLLRQEATTALSMLNDQHFNGFEAAFILRTKSPLYRYDYILEIAEALIFGSSTHDDLDISQSYQKVYTTLQKGLGDRVKLVNLISTQTESWETGYSRPNRSTGKKLMIGLVVNPDTVNRIIDHGPSAEEKSQAVAFRKFWGDKAELRRFRDGSIVETLSWSDKSGGPPVLEQVTRHVVGRHFGHDVGRNLVFIGGGFKKMLLQGESTAVFQPLVEAYKRLETDIRRLDGLPLSIRQMMPADPQLRYASITSPNSGQRSAPANVVIQFEGSARWPDDLIAIQRTKIAFLLKLSGLLQESSDALIARIGLENGEHDVLNQAFLDIVHDSGAAFRLRIHHDREYTLLQRTLEDRTLDPNSKEVAALALTKYKRDYIKAPMHTQAVAGLCSRHPVMSGTIRLMKKWFASHLLSNHIAEEVIELIVARTFVQPWPWQTPSSIQTGFLRTLFYLSRWDWRTDPLIVDLSGGKELKPADFQSMTTKFEAWRKIDPGLNRVALFAASNIDPDGTTWTDGRPSKVVASRMTELARAACAEVEEKQLSLQADSLFASPLTDFDFVIHLLPELGPKKTRRRRSATIGVAYKNLELDVTEDSSTVGYDPMSDLLRELETSYGSAILFFSGGEEQPIIAGLWHPQTATRAWKLNLAYSAIPNRQPDKDEIQATIKKEATLAEISRLGGNMIQRIEIHTH